MRYVVVKNPFSTNVNVNKIDGNDVLFIPFDPTNTNYQQFKQSINDDTAQLEDADGNLMTADEAKTFVATLP